jgi:hypothetical protein
MKKSALLAVLLLAGSAFASTEYNNFNGYDDFWTGFGYPNTATFGELFTAPNNADMVLNSFSFYMGNAYKSGNIITGAYIATWTGSHAGTLLYDSGPYDYDNSGDKQLTWTPNVKLSPGAEYVMFLSISKFYGQSSGQAYLSGGFLVDGLKGAAYDNNGGDFNSLFTSDWIGPLSPHLAVDLKFSSTPEPGSLALLGTGILGGIGVLRRKLF